VTVRDYTQDRVFLSQPQLQARWGKVDKTIQRWAQQDDFPPTFKFNGRNHWRLSDIEAWEIRQIASRGNRGGTERPRLEVSGTVQYKTGHREKV